MSEIHFETDANVHKASTSCQACRVPEYPRPHGANTCPGLLHAEFRYTTEASFTEVTVIERCDFCRYAGIKAVDVPALRDVALALVSDADKKDRKLAGEAEPSFTLWARDAFAVPVIMMWQNLAICMGVRQQKLIESSRLVRDMVDWQRRHKTKIPD